MAISRLTSTETRPLRGAAGLDDLDQQALHERDPQEVPDRVIHQLAVEADPGRTTRPRSRRAGRTALARLIGTAKLMF